MTSFADSMWVCGLPVLARLCKKYPAVREALLKSLLETVVRYHKILAGIEVGTGCGYKYGGYGFGYRCVRT